MRFVKMHGAGNDYVYVDAFEFPEVLDLDLPALSVLVSHRRFGIGADGLIVVAPNPEADGEMLMFNADGSRSEMCGNGLRCVAKIVHDRHVRRPELRLATGAGLKTATVFPGADGLAESVEIDMGAPILEPARIPTTLEGEPPVERELVAGDRTFLATAIGMGNPHCVIYVDDVMSFPVEKYGPLVENHPAFPRRVNAEFVQVVSRTELVQRTWERGSGETWACGTGASAVCAASVITGRTGNDVSIRLLGGELRLSWAPGSGVRLAGNAVEVFEGEMPRKWIEETSRK